MDHAAMFLPRLKIRRWTDRGSVKAPREAVSSVPMTGLSECPMSRRQRLE